MTSTGPRDARSEPAPQVLRWDPGLGRFRAEPAAELGELDVADSWLLEDGAARALPQHRDRFVAACAQRGVPDRGSTAFFDAACAALPGTGRWFPRVEYRARAGFHVRLRPAPPRSEAVILGVADGPDPRRAPRVKGPDLERLVELRARAATRVGADEVVLRSGDGIVLEGAVSSILWWRGDTLCAPPPELPLLPGVTRAVLLNLAAQRGTPIRFEACTLPELDGVEVWCVNALHGIRAVTGWIGAPCAAAPPRHAAAWRRALAQYAG